MIRVLQQGPCVQYQRDDGGWRVGHVYEVVTLDGVSAVLVRECQTGELLVVGIGEVQPYPQSPIPEPGGEESKQDEVWHSPDEYPGSDRDVMADICGRLLKAWCGPITRTWHLLPATTPPPLRWRELKEGE